MNIKTRFYRLTLAAKAVTPCTQKRDVEGVLNVVFKAGFADGPTGTKTTMIEEADNRYHIWWKNDDVLSIFDDNLAECRFVAKTPEGVDSPVADLSGAGTFNGASFTGKTNQWGETKTYYALYPRSQSATVTAEGRYSLPINTGMFQNQIAQERNFPISPNAQAATLAGVYVAKSDNGFFSFKNMTAYIKFTITQDDIIKVGFNNNTTKGHRIGGGFEIDYSGEEPVLVKTDQTTWNQVTLCKDKNYSQPIPPGTYYLTILPNNFNELYDDQGDVYFKMLIYTVDGGKNTVTQRIDFKNPVDITPGMILDLGTLTHE